MKGYKIIKLIALVREDDAEEVANGHLNTATFDASLGSYVETNDLTDEDKEAFADILGEEEEEEAT